MERATVHPRAPVSLRRMEGYLAGLPGGLDAHPECRHKASIARSVLLHFPTDRLPTLPAPLQALVDAPPPSSLWISEVHATALFLAICDAQFGSDEEYLTYSYEFNRQLLRSPLYRVLMFVATPTRLVTTASMQWNALHRGSTLHIDLLGPAHAVSQMRFPRGLFPALLLRCFATAQRAVLEGSGAKSPTVELRGATLDRAEFEVTWL